VSFCRSLVCLLIHHSETISEGASQLYDLFVGGDNISVTGGVVSRVEPTQYVHGAAHLMAIQIDAAINPGNSGGPALMEDKVVGVAFQNLAGAENIGYIIPVPVINHFLSDVEETGHYVGFCSLGVTCQPTENVQLRDHLRSLFLSLSLTLWIYSCGSRKKVPQRIYFYLRDGVNRARTVSFSSNFVDVSLYPFTHNHCAICFC
jgi:hypothetical protein